MFLDLPSLDPVSAAESAHPRAETTVPDWRRPRDQSSGCQVGASPVSLQQPSGGSSQSLWIWVQPLRVLPWKWPVQKQGERLQPPNTLTTVLYTNAWRGNVYLVCFWQVSETQELLHLLHISPATAFYKSLVIKYCTYGHYIVQDIAFANNQEEKYTLMTFILSFRSQDPSRKIKVCFVYFNSLILNFFFSHTVTCSLMSLYLICFSICYCPWASLSLPIRIIDQPSNAANTPFWSELASRCRHSNNQLCKLWRFFG